MRKDSHLVWKLCSWSHEVLRRLFTPFWFCFEISRKTKCKKKSSILLLFLIDACWAIVFKTGCKKWKMFILLDDLIAVKCVFDFGNMGESALTSHMNDKKHCEMAPPFSNSVKSFFSKPRASQCWVHHHCFI